MKSNLLWPAFVLQAVDNGECSDPWAVKILNQMVLDTASDETEDVAYETILQWQCRLWEYTKKAKFVYIYRFPGHPLLLCRHGDRQAVSLGVAPVKRTSSQDSQSKVKNLRVASGFGRLQGFCAVYLKPAVQHLACGNAGRFASQLWTANFFLAPLWDPSFMTCRVTLGP